jgi:hypothetical protein
MKSRKTVTVVGSLAPGPVPLERRRRVVDAKSPLIALGERIADANAK